MSSRMRIDWFSRLASILALTTLLAAAPARAESQEGTEEDTAQDPTPEKKADPPPKAKDKPKDKDKPRTKDKEKSAKAKDKPKDDDDTPWWLRKPTQRTQTQKDSDERGGINPCNTKDVGFGIYDSWSRGISMGQMIIPARGGVSKSGRFDVMIHFHGHEAVRKEWVKVMDGAVLVGIDLGIGSGAYTQAFATPQAFKDLIASIEREVAKKRGLEPDEVKVRKVGLSAWSAGYGSVQQILGQSLGKKLVDTVVLLDGFHTGYAPDGDLERQQIEPFIEFAKKAKAKSKMMFISHSSIIPPGYASTTETSNFLIHLLGGKPKKGKARKSDPMGLELNSTWDSGNLHVRGYDGNDKADHCAHIGLFKDVLKSRVKPRWKSPKGQGPKKEAKKDKDKKS